MNEQEECEVREIMQRNLDKMVRDLPLWDRFCYFWRRHYCLPWPKPRRVEL